jgi:hypothetical protein
MLMGTRGSATTFYMSPDGRRMIFEELETNLYNEIINVFDFKNIYHQFNVDLIRDNYIKQ